MIRAITYDFWDTLYAHDPNEEYRRLHLRAGRLRELPALRDLPPDRLAAKLELARQLAVAAGDEPFSEYTARLFLENADIEAAANLLATVQAVIEDAVLDIPPSLIPGVKDVLRELAGSYRIGLISDTGLCVGRVLRRVMQRDGIARHFNAFTFSDETGRRKPHPAQFNGTARSLGVDPTEIAHVGDLVPADVRGAKAVGACAILYTGRRGDQPDSDHADAVIAEHAELFRVLRELDAAC